MLRSTGSRSGGRARRMRFRSRSGSVSTRPSSRTPADAVEPERLRIQELLAEAEAAERGARPSSMSSIRERIRGRWPGPPKHRRQTQPHQRRRTRGSQHCLHQLEQAILPTAQGPVRGEPKLLQSLPCLWGLHNTSMPLRPVPRRPASPWASLCPNSSDMMAPGKSARTPRPDGRGALARRYFVSGSGLASG